MIYATLSDVRARIMTPGPTGATAEWTRRMLHFVPDLPVVADRARYLAEKAAGEVVLDLGCAGPISEGIRLAARGYYGVDRVAGPNVTAVLDLDATPDALPVYPDVTLLVAAELLEHLANPGRFLLALRAAYPGLPMWVSVPNAGVYRMHNGTHEEVNAEHVAWYSYTTLSTLLRRTGYTLDVVRWYNGQPHTAEGLVARVR